jgi:hypothetical protein
MNEKDIINRVGPPDKIVRLKDRLLSHEWRCFEVRFHRGRHHSNSGAGSLREVQRDCLRSG